MAALDVSVLLEKLAAAGKELNVPEDVWRHAFAKENFGKGGIPATGPVQTDRVSPKAANGVMQVIPSTFQGLIKNGTLPPDANPNDVDTNIKAGMAVLAERLKARGGNKAAALADYNGGLAAGNAVVAGREPPAEETRKYIQGLTPMADNSTSGATTPRGNFRVSTSSSSSGLDPIESSAQLAEYIRRSQDNVSLMQDAVTGKQEWALSAANAATDYGKAKSTSIGAQADIAALTERNRAEVSALIPGGGHDADSRFVMEMAEVEKLRNRQDQMRQEIDAQDQVTIFDDPLQWLVNQVKLPKMKGAYNSTVVEAQTRLQRIQENKLAIEAQAKSDMPTTEAHIRTQANAEQAAVAAEAAYKAAQQMSASEQDTIVLAHAQMQADGANYQAYSALASKLAEKQHYSEVSSMTDKQDKETASMLEKVNLKRKAFGGEPVTVAMFKQMNAARRSEIMEDALKPSFSSPGDAYIYAQSNGFLATIGKADSSLASFMAKERGSKEQTAAEQAVAKSLGAKLATTPLEQITAMAWDKRVENDTKKLVADSYDATKLPKDHWYRVNVTDPILNSPRLKDNLITQIVQEQAKLSPSGAVDDKIIAQSIMAKAVADPANISKYAAAYSQYYRIAQEDQWQRGPMKMGYPRPVGYVLDVLDGPAKVNTWSQAEVERWMIANVTEMKRRATFDATALDARGMPGRLQQLPL